MEKNTELDIQKNKSNKEVAQNERQTNMNFHKGETVKSEKLRFKNADKLYE